METQNFTSQEIENLKNDTDWSKAIKDIKEGSNFNGKIYTKRVGNGKSFDLSIYVDGNYVSLGRHFKEYVEEIKEIFNMLIKEVEKQEVEDLAVKNNDNTFFNTGLGYSAKKSELKEVMWYGFDGIENI